MFIAKRINENSKEYTDKGLNAILSDGTKKGIGLFSEDLTVLSSGGTLMVDEIEDSLSRAFVFNLINLFMDDMVNTRHANLIFTTHYSSFLDVLRSDAIHVCYVKEGKCNAYNLNSIKPDSRLILSKQFDDNVFEMQANGEYFGKVKMNLIRQS